MKYLILLIAFLLMPPCFGADIGLLTDAVSKICPIKGLSGDGKNPSALRIDFSEDATEEQKQSARAYLESVQPNDPSLQAADVPGFLADIAADLTFTVDDYATAVVLSQISDQAVRSFRIAQYVQQQADPLRQAALFKYAVKHHIPLPNL